MHLGKHCETVDFVDELLVEQYFLEHSDEGDIVDVALVLGVESIEVVLGDREGVDIEIEDLDHLHHQVVLVEGHGINLADEGLLVGHGIILLRIPHQVLLLVIIPSLHLTIHWYKGLFILQGFMERIMEGVMERVMEGVFVDRFGFREGFRGIFNLWNLLVFIEVVVNELGSFKFIMGVYTGLHGAGVVGVGLHDTVLVVLKLKDLEEVSEGGLQFTLLNLPHLEFLPQFGLLGYFFLSGSLLNCLPPSSLSGSSGKCRFDSATSSAPLCSSLSCSPSASLLQTIITKHLLLRG
jgi:hypothetical protein